VIRQSKRNADSESKDVQLHDVRRKAAELGADLPDDLIAIDLAVSAFKVRPMKRPKISKVLARLDARRLPRGGRAPAPATSIDSS
jgi:hypothetical protein